MTESNQKHGLIARILDLLDFLQKNEMDLDSLSNGGASLSSLPDAQNIQAAFEVIRFMDEMPGGFLIYHADGDEQIIYANKALLWIFQCDTMAEFRALTGNSFRGIVHPDDLEQVEESIRRQITNSQYDLDYVEYRARRKDGSICWIEDYGHFIHSQTVGDIFYVFLGDATEKRDRLLTERSMLIHEKNETEQTLQRLIQEYDQERALISQEYLRRLRVIEGLSVSYESILYANLDKSQILPYRLSSRSESIFDANYQVRDFNQCISRYAETWVCEEDRALFSQALNPDYIRKRLSEESNYCVNYRAHAGRESQYLQVRVVNVSRGSRISQVVLGFQSVDWEIRQEMEHRQALVDALENANLANIAKNTFLSNMSHDMRTPLNAIFGFTSLAKLDVQNSAAVQTYLERIETASRQLLDLINKVLELSQTESIGVQAAEVECDLLQVIQEAYDSLLPQAQEKNITLSLDCSEVRHRGVLGDPEKLRQLLIHLAHNAICYTNPGGQVSITAAEREERQYAVFYLTVADNGIGINESFLGHIFEPFARERNTTLSGVHGLGLGLTIAKNIVDMMGGTIKVQSRPGHGSTFTVTLRLRVLSAVKDSGEIPIVRKKPLKILLVEDNEINRELETELLREEGFSIEAAADGILAVERITNAAPGEFDLILMDIQMPVMDGWEASAAIRKLENPALARIPIIAVSANVFESDLRKSAESGIDAHLPKPMDIHLLLKTIEEIRQKRENS